MVANKAIYVGLGDVAVSAAGVNGFVGIASLGSGSPGSTLIVAGQSVVATP
jgi:hypothetical protein